MPTVPGQPKTADPFGNYVKGKDQSQMPKGNVLPMFKPSETDIAIALATIHSQGRLFVPNPKGLIEDRRQFEQDRPVPGGKPDNDRTGPGTPTVMAGQ